MDNFIIWPTNAETIMLECQRCTWAFDTEDEDGGRASVQLSRLIARARDHRIDGCPDA